MPELASLSGESTDEPARHDIRNFQTRIERGAGKHKLSIGYYAQGRPKMLSFVDRGKQIDIYQRTDRATVLAALQVAPQKWGVVTVTGPAEFQVLCAELAREHGFRIQNLPASSAIIQQEQSSPDATGQRSPVSPHEAHRRNIMSKMEVKNLSQLDYMIAVRMRVTGHSQETITKELLKVVVPTRTSENRDWSLYARRTVNAVFGPRGDYETQQLQCHASSWLRLEGRPPPHQQLAQALADDVIHGTRSSRGLEIGG